MSRSTGGHSSSGSRSSGVHSSSSRSSGVHHSSSSYSSPHRSMGRSSSGSMSGSSTGSSYRRRPYYSSGPDIHVSSFGNGPRYYGGGYGGYDAHAARFVLSIFKIVMFMMVCCLIFIGIIFASAGHKASSIPQSTHERTSLTGTSYSTQDIDDEFGWLGNDESMAKFGMKQFYSKTGVQPYLVFHKYDSSLNTDAKKQKWTENYYAKHIGNEYTFLVVYFAGPDEGNPDAEAGDLAYTSGTRIDTVMDSEAVDIFFAYWDQNYYDSSLSEGEVISNTFYDTADAIMSRPTNAADVCIVIAIGCFAIAGGIIIIVIMKIKRKNDAAKAAETERILNTPVEKLHSDDPLADKYAGGREDGANPFEKGGS